MSNAINYLSTLPEISDRQAITNTFAQSIAKLFANQIFVLFILVFAAIGFAAVLIYIFKPTEKKSAAASGDFQNNMEMQNFSDIKISNVTPVNDQNEIIAAITAAITAYRSEQGYAVSDGFRVVSFKKRK